MAESPAPRIAVVDDEASLRETLALALGREGFASDWAGPSRGR